MEKEKLGTFYVILGYILLPFVVLYKIITDPMQGMTPGLRIIYIGLLGFIAIQLFS